MILILLPIMVLYNNNKAKKKTVGFYFILEMQEHFIDCVDCVCSNLEQPQRCFCLCNTVYFKPAPQEGLHCQFVSRIRCVES